MFPSDLDNAYAYEIERRKDEIREAAQSNFVHQYLEKSQSPVWLVVILSILAGLLAIFLGS